MIATINHADVPSKKWREVNENFAELSGGGGETSVTSADITDATAVGRSVLTAANAGAARTAIGAGTSSVVVGSTVPAGPIAVAIPGTSAEAARADHAHAFPTQFATGRIISLTGAATGSSAAFNGAANASIAVTLATPTTTVRGGVLQGATVADCTVAADGTSAGTQLNALLAQLRVAGIIA